MNTVIENLKKNNMEVYTLNSRGEVVPLLKSLLQKGDTVAVGGSKTLDEANVLTLLRNGDYKFLDRYAEGLSREDVEEVFRKSFFADAYISSANAVTEQGEIFNVDGNGNRVAALLFGPKRVFLVIGKNKIVKDLDEAVKRVSDIAAPLNTKRLSCDTYCEKKGKCAAKNTDAAHMTEGCAGPGRICCDYTVMAYQRKAGRVCVILVDEALGF